MPCAGHSAVPSVPRCVCTPSRVGPVHASGSAATETHAGALRFDRSIKGVVVSLHLILTPHALARSATLWQRPS
jgi:hypothetical protein